MSALQKLQEKIEQWRVDHESIKLQNSNLKSQLAGLASSQNEHKSVVLALEEKKKVCTSQEETIELLQLELEEKDAEIEKIIAQVESLLS